MGQEHISIKEGFPLTDASVVSNVATNEAYRKERKEMTIDGKDVFPANVTTQDFYATRGIFNGAIKSGSLWVNSGGVTITSDPDGGSTTGLTMSAGVFQLVKESVAVVTMDGTTGSASFSGTVTADALSTLGGTMSTGSIIVGSGGVIISNAAGGTSGIVIGANKFQCIYDGAATVDIDGATGAAYFKGEVYASKFTLTADEENSLDMTTGTHYLGTSCVIGDAESIRTIGGLVRHWGPKATAPPAGMREGDTYWNTATEVFYRYSGSEWVVEESADHLSTVAGNALSIAATAQETADGEIVGFFQATEPASGMTFGDIWIDTDKSNPLTSTCIYRYQNADGSSTAPLAWTATPTNAIGLLYLEAYKSGRAASVADAKAVGANENADSKITTFYQASDPVAKSIGDMWVDTDDGNKLYRASATGSSNWVPVRDAGATAGLSAIQPGGGVSVDGSKYITTIDMSSGVTIRSSSSTAKTQLTSGGIAIYNSAGSTVVQVDHTNGLYVNNVYDGSPGVTERLSLAYNGTEQGYLVGNNGTLVLRATSTRHLWLEAGGTVYIGSSTADTFITSGGSSRTLYLGDSTFNWGTIKCYGKMQIYDYIDQDGSTYNTFNSRIDCADLVEAKHFKLDASDGKIYFNNGTAYYLYYSGGDIYWYKNGVSTKLN